MQYYCITLFDLLQYIQKKSTKYLIFYKFVKNTLNFSQKTIDIPQKYDILGLINQISGYAYMPSYSNFTNEVLAVKVALGEDKAFFELSSRFDAMINDILTSVSIDVSEKEDLYQEGLIGLFKAALAYKSSRGASFSTFAYLCIKHSILSSVRVYFSKKNEPVRIGSPFDEVLAHQCPDFYAEPEKLYIEKENIRLIKEIIDTSLSNYERRVFKLFLKGLSYEVIADELSVEAKSVDNAIQRIRGKLKKFIK